MKEKVVIVDASYETLATYENVCIFVPSEKTDKHMVKQQANSFRIKKTKELVYVPSHYRRGDIFKTSDTDRIFVTRRFYLKNVCQGKKTVVDLVTVRKKIDHSKNDRISIIIDIQNERSNDSPNIADFILKIGSPKGQHLIPGTEKFIYLEKVNR